MTWKSFHNRGEVLRSVIEVADTRLDGVLPMHVDGVHEIFGDELALLGALQFRWHTRLAGRIERELVHEPMDLTLAVVVAWRATAEENPGLLAVLDRCTAEPRDDEMATMLARSAAKVAVLLAVMAGRSSLPADAATVRIGAEIESRARLGRASTPVDTESSLTLLGRLRAAFAA